MKWNRTRVSDRLGVEYPIIQGPLAGFPSPRLAGAVSRHGALGSFAAHGLSATEIAEAVLELRATTSNPFATNLWVSRRSNGAVSPDAGAFRALVEAGSPAFSFVFGVPPREMLDECRARGIVTIGTASSVDEAAMLQRADVDVIVAAGFEAGGIDSTQDRVGTMALVPRIVDAVSRPVVAAGGIADARGVVAAFALGAEGVQLGTAFLACEESGASPHHRAALLSGRDYAAGDWSGRRMIVPKHGRARCLLDSLVAEASALLEASTPWMGE